MYINGEGNAEINLNIYFSRHWNIQFAIAAKNSFGVDGGSSMDGII